MRRDGKYSMDQLLWSILLVQVVTPAQRIFGQNYPVPGFLNYENLPQTQFSCEGKVIGGYYADIDTGCQMFHVCTLGQQGEVRDMKFLCLNGTVFAQETRVCERLDEVNCAESERFFHLNLELYHPPSSSDYDYYYYDEYEQQSHNRPQRQEQSESFERGVNSGRSLPHFDPRHPSDSGTAETMEHLTFTSQSAQPPAALAAASSSSPATSEKFDNNSGRSRGSPDSVSSDSSDKKAPLQSEIQANGNGNNNNNQGRRGQPTTTRVNPFIIRKDQLPKETPGSSTTARPKDSQEQQQEYEDYEDSQPPTAEAQEEIHRVVNADFDVPRIPFSSPNDTWITVTNGKPFLPRLRREVRAVPDLEQAMDNAENEELWANHQVEAQLFGRRSKRAAQEEDNDVNDKTPPQRALRQRPINPDADDAQKVDISSGEPKKSQSEQILEEPSDSRPKGRKRRRRRKKKLVKEISKEDASEAPAEEAQTRAPFRPQHRRYEQDHLGKILEDVSENQDPVSKAVPVQRTVPRGRQLRKQAQAAPSNLRVPAELLPESRGASFLLEDEEPTTERARFVPKFNSRGQSNEVVAGLRRPLRRPNADKANSDREYRVRPTLEAAILSTSELPPTQSVQDAILGRAGEEESSDRDITFSKSHEDEKPGTAKATREEQGFTRELSKVSKSSEESILPLQILDNRLDKTNDQISADLPAVDPILDVVQKPESEISADESSPGGSLEVAEILKKNTPQQRKYLEAAKKSQSKEERTENILKALGVKPISKNSFKNTRNSRTEIFKKKIASATPVPVTSQVGLVDGNLANEAGTISKFDEPQSDIHGPQELQDPNVNETSVPVIENDNNSKNNGQRLGQPPKRRKKVLVSKKKKLAAIAKEEEKIEGNRLRGLRARGRTTQQQRATEPTEVPTPTVTTLRPASSRPRFGSKRKLLPSFANLPRARSRQASTSEAPWEVTDPPPSVSAESTTPATSPIPRITTRRTTTTSTTTTTTTQEPIIVESVPYVDSSSTVPTPREGRNRQAVVITSAAPPVDVQGTSTNAGISLVSQSFSIPPPRQQPAKVKKAKQVIFDDYDYDENFSKQEFRDLRRRKFSENFLKNLKSRKRGGKATGKDLVEKTTRTSFTSTEANANSARSRGRKPTSTTESSIPDLPRIEEQEVSEQDEPIFLGVPASTIEPAVFVDQNDIVTDVPLKGFPTDQFEDDPSQFNQPIFSTSVDFQDLEQTSTQPPRTTTRRTFQTPWFQSFRTSTENSVNDVVDDLSDKPIIQKHAVNSIPDDLNAEVILKARQDSYVRQQLRQKQVQNQLIELQRETENLQLILQQKQHQNLLLVDPLRDTLGRRKPNGESNTNDDSDSARSPQSRQETLDPQVFQDIFNAVSNEEFGRKSVPKRNSFQPQAVSENLIDSPDPGEPETPRNIQQIRDQERPVKTFGGANVQPPSFKPPQNPVTVQPPAFMFQQRGGNQPTQTLQNVPGARGNAVVNRASHGWTWPSNKAANSNGNALQPAQEDLGRNFNSAEQNNPQDNLGPQINPDHNLPAVRGIPQTIKEAQTFTQNARGGNVDNPAGLGSIPQLPNNNDEPSQFQNQEQFVNDQPHTEILPVPWIVETVKGMADEDFNLDQPTDFPDADFSQNPSSGFWKPSTETPLQLNNVPKRQTTTRQPAAVPKTASQPNNSGQKKRNNQQGRKAPRIGAGGAAILAGNFSPILISRKTFVRTTTSAPTPTTAPTTFVAPNNFQQPISPPQSRNFQSFANNGQSFTTTFQSFTTQTPGFVGQNFQQTFGSRNNFQQSFQPQRQSFQTLTTTMQPTTSSQRPVQFVEQNFRQQSFTPPQVQNFQSTAAPARIIATTTRRPTTTRSQGFSAWNNFNRLKPSKTPQSNVQPNTGNVQKSFSNLQTPTLNNIQSSLKNVGITTGNVIQEQQSGSGGKGGAQSSVKNLNGRDPKALSQNNFQAPQSLQQQQAGFQQRADNGPGIIDRTTAAQFPVSTTTTATTTRVTRKGGQTFWPWNSSSSNPWFQGSNFKLQSLWSTSTTTPGPISFKSNQNDAQGFQQRSNNNQQQQGQQRAQGNPVKVQQRTQVTTTQAPPPKSTTTSNPFTPRTIGPGSLVQKIPPPPTTPRSQRSLTNLKFPSNEANEQGNQRAQEDGPQARKAPSDVDVTSFDDFPFTADVIGPLNRVQALDKVAYPTYDSNSLPDTSFSCIGKTPGRYYADYDTRCQMYHICSQSRVKGRIIDYRFICTNGTVFNELISACDTYERVDCGGGLSIYSLLDDVYRPSHVPTEVELLEVGIGTAIGQKRLAGTGQTF